MEILYEHLEYVSNYKLMMVHIFEADLIFNSRNYAYEYNTKF
jgi:hypothetical protein